MALFEEEITAILNFIADNVQFAVAITIPFTILAVILSTKYAIDNIFTKKKLKSETQTADETGDYVAESKDINWTPDEGHDSLLGEGDAGPDPVQFCEHLQSEVKKARQRVATREIQSKLTEDDKMNERETQRQQLEAIFKLMESQQDKFGVASVDDIQEQMKLYV